MSGRERTLRRRYEELNSPDAGKLIATGEREWERQRLENARFLEFFLFFFFLIKRAGRGRGGQGRAGRGQLGQVGPAGGTRGGTRGGAVTIIAKINKEVW